MLYGYKKFVDLLNGKNDMMLKAGNKFYIPFKKRSIRFVILGVNTNPNEDCNYDFVDIMCLEPIPDLVWSDNIFQPYYKSKIMKTLNDQKHFFPEEIRNNIIRRDAKFLTSVNLIDKSKEYEKFNIGYIWIPSIVELWGKESFDDYPNYEQYEYFKNIECNKYNGWIRSVLYTRRNPISIYYDYIYEDDCTIRKQYNDKDKAYMCLRLKINRE